MWRDRAPPACWRLLLWLTPLRHGWLPVDLTRNKRRLPYVNLIRSSTLRLSSAPELNGRDRSHLRCMWRAMYVMLHRKSLFRRGAGAHAYINDRWSRKDASHAHLLTYQVAWRQRLIPYHRRLDWIAIQLVYAWAERASQWLVDIR